jgi:hypothetical protein
LFGRLQAQLLQTAASDALQPTAEVVGILQRWSGEIVGCISEDDERALSSKQASSRQVWGGQRQGVGDTLELAEGGGVQRDCFWRVWMWMQSCPLPACPRPTFHPSSTAQLQESVLCIPTDRRLPKIRLRSRQLHRLLGQVRRGR